jgi:hypothetical protein
MKMPGNITPPGQRLKPTHVQTLDHVVYLAEREVSKVCALSPDTSPPLARASVA